MNTFEQLFFQHYCTGTFYEFILILKLEKVTNIRPTVRFPHPHGPQHLAFPSFFLHNASPSPPLPPSLPPSPAEIQHVQALSKSHTWTPSSSRTIGFGSHLSSSLGPQPSRSTFSFKKKKCFLPPLHFLAVENAVSL